jgi:adiponectin receptor
MYYFGVVNCFILSTIFHTFSNHSPECHKPGNELDHLGAVIAIWGTAIPYSQFAFRDETSGLRYTHYALNCGSALASGLFMLRPKFRLPEYRKTRFYMYFLLEISAFLPVAQSVQMYGFQELNARMPLRYFLGLGLLNFTGDAIHAARIPERWHPKRFDIWGSSHQIMHVPVFCGALSHERGMMKATQYWTEKGQ